MLYFLESEIFSSRIIFCVWRHVFQYFLTVWCKWSWKSEGSGGGSDTELHFSLQKTILHGHCVRQWERKFYASARAHERENLCDSCTHINLFMTFSLQIHRMTSIFLWVYITMWPIKQKIEIESRRRKTERERGVMEGGKKTLHRFILKI